MLIGTKLIGINHKSTRMAYTVMLDLLLGAIWLRVSSADFRGKRILVLFVIIESEALMGD